MMLYKLISPSMVKATIQLPASKSISNRALIINALGKGIYPPENLSDCDDTQVMIKALTEGKETIDIMAAGTAMRFLTAYLSATPGERTITGTARMQQRPIQILVNALRELGAEIEYVHNEGYPPLRIKGAELKGNAISLKGNVSSQYISALLMIGPVLKDGLTLHLTGEIISRPYINLTLQLMQDFGAKAAWTSPSSISVAPQPYQSVPFTVESDWRCLLLVSDRCFISRSRDRTAGTIPQQLPGRQSGSRGFLPSGSNYGIYPSGSEDKKDRQGTGTTGRRFR